MKFGQLIEYNKRNICRQENEAGRLVPATFCFYKVKASGLQLCFNIFLKSLT